MENEVVENSNAKNNGEIHEEKSIVEEDFQQEIVIDKEKYFVIKKGKNQQENFDEKNTNLPAVRTNKKVRRKPDMSIFLGILFFLLDATVGTVFVTVIYSILIIFTILFFIASLVGVAVFVLGICSLVFDIPTIFNQMGTLSYVLVSIGLTCISIFFMVLSSQSIKAFIRGTVRYLQWNIIVVRNAKMKYMRNKIDFNLQKADSYKKNANFS